MISAKSFPPSPKVNDVQTKMFHRCLSFCLRGSVYLWYHFLSGPMFLPGCRVALVLCPMSYVPYPRRTTPWKDWSSNALITIHTGLIYIYDTRHLSTSQSFKPKISILFRKKLKKIPDWDCSSVLPNFYFIIILVAVNIKALLPAQEVARN